MPKPDLSDYVEVSERIAQLREKFAGASLQAEVIRWPDDGFPFIVVQAFCYRDSADSRPGVGWAAEPFPGRTPYTKDSELQNAETSAWGRAIVAALAADTKKGIASREEVESRAASTEDEGKSKREVSSRREGKDAARTSGDGVDSARVGEGESDSQTSPDTPGGAEVTASAPSGSISPPGETSEGEGSTPPSPSDEATEAFLFALNAALRNAFGDRVTAANAYMKSFLGRAGVESASALSDLSRVELLEQLAERAGAGKEKV